MRDNSVNGESRRSASEGAGVLPGHCCVGVIVALLPRAFYSDIELVIANALVHYRYLREDDISDEKVLNIRHKYVLLVGWFHLGTSRSI